MFVQPAGCKGLGLFAHQDIAFGIVVVRMSKPVLLKSSSARLARDWEGVCRLRNLPHDAAIHLAQGGFETVCALVYDAEHTEDCVPLWYRINHSASHPNVRVRRSQSLVEFVSICPIARGDEILFDYGEPDPSWNNERLREHSCCQLTCLFKHFSSTLFFVFFYFIVSSA